MKAERENLDMVVIIQPFGVSCEIITYNMTWCIHQTLSVISGILYAFCILQQHHKCYLSQDTGFIGFAVVIN